MTYQVGEAVTVESYKEKGIGKVVAIEQVFNINYLEIFFSQTKELFRIAEAHVSPLKDNFSLLLENREASFPTFMVQYLANEIEALLTKQGVISAGNFRLTPLPHQILAVDFILSQFRSRCLIADEVGLGKTIEGAMVFEELKQRGMAKRVLIIAPSGLTQQWKEEMLQKFGEEFVVIDREVFHSLREIHGRESNVWLKHDQVITSIDFIKPKVLSPFLNEKEFSRREEHNKFIFEMAAQGQWDVVIFDEAHKLSKAGDGSETARYKIGKELAEIAPVLLLLSATPHQGDAGRFFHLLNLLDPIAFSAMEDVTPEKLKEYLVRNKKRAVVDHQGKRLFKQRLTTVYTVKRLFPEDASEQALYDEVTAYVTQNYNLAMGTNDRAFGFLMILFQRLVSSSSRAILKALQDRVQKLTSIKDLMELVPSNEEFDEQEAQDRNAEELLQDLQNTSGVYSKEGLQKELLVLESLTGLAQKASFGRQDVKARELLNIISEVCRREGEPQTKFLIFTEFVATQKYLAELLEACGYEVALLNGQMSTQEKMQARDSFRENTQFLISTDAGGEGINLQFCHVIVNYDMPWNPMKIEQRIGRLDRIGQEHNVLVFNFMIEQTVEERVREILENKLTLIKEQFGEDKLADILSTLQDEFNFEKLYIDALIKREKEAQELEIIAQQIYEKAQTILAKDDLLLPQSSFEERNFQDKLLEVTSEKVKSLVENYLKQKRLNIIEYSKRKDSFYFDFPAEDGVIHYQNVVFDREMALEKDSFDYFHINHTFVRDILEQAKRNLQEGKVAHLRIDLKESYLVGQKGLWAVFRLSITNHLDYNKMKLIPIFVDEFGLYNKEISRKLEQVFPRGVSHFTFDISTLDLKQLKRTLNQEAQRLAEDFFSEEELNWSQSLEKEKTKLQNYFRNQETAIQRIAITNIREGKLKDLQRRKQETHEKLKHRATLVPKLEMTQIATVIFG